MSGRSYKTGELQLRGLSGTCEVWLGEVFVGIGSPKSHDVGPFGAGQRV